MPTHEQLRLTWRTSSYSNADNGACVEAAYPLSVTAVRDSKDRASGSIVAMPNAWHALLTTLCA